MFIQRFNVLIGLRRLLHIAQRRRNGVGWRPEMVQTTDHTQNSVQWEKGIAEMPCSQASKLLYPAATTYWILPGTSADNENTQHIQITSKKCIHFTCYCDVRNGIENTSYCAVAFSAANLPCSCIFCSFSCIPSAASLAKLAMRKPMKN